ncbi:MAG: hypothetical protein KAY82_03080 [Hylemonella sp.]|nr:hypothetical protein [Hylemonella sp.]
MSGNVLSSGSVSSLQNKKILTLSIGAASFKLTATTTSNSTMVSETLTFVAAQTSFDDGG